MKQKNNSTENIGPMRKLVVKNKTTHHESDEIFHRTRFALTKKKNNEDIVPGEILAVAKKQMKQEDQFPRKRFSVKNKTKTHTQNSRFFTGRYLP